MAEAFTLETRSQGKGDKRRVVIIKNQNSTIPFYSIGKQVAGLSVDEIKNLKETLVVYVMKFT